MKVLAINGSVKAKNSCTDKILQPFLTGMQKAGAETETIYLAEKNIKHCTGCMSCWFKTLGRCVINDDMADILDKMINTDLVIFATPLHFRSLNGLMKDFLDRTISIGVPYHASRYWTNAKKFLISPCAFPDFNEFTLLIDTFKKNFQDAYIGEIVRPAAELMNIDNFKSQYDRYCGDLEKAGEEMVNDGNISDATKEKLNQFWLSPQEQFKMFEEKMKSISE